MTTLPTFDSTGAMPDSPNKTRRKKALGRGLGALIPNKPIDATRDYFECPLDKIEPSPTQPRKHFDPEALSDLSASIKESGLIQPLVVRKLDAPPERYELIAGERRWRASRMAGLTAVPVVVKDVDDAVAFALALIENIQRQDLNPIEEAMAYQRLLDEFEFTQSELADQVGKSRSAISNSIRLLNLPGSVRESLASGDITSGHARTLLTLSEEDATGLATMVLDEELTVRQTEHRARQLREGLSLEQLGHPGHASGGERAEAAQARALDASDDEAAAQQESVSTVSFEKADWRDDDAIRTISSRLARALDTIVQLKDRHGRGRIEIQYDDYDSLRAILRRLDIHDTDL